MIQNSVYPSRTRDRRKWIEEKRRTRNVVDHREPYAFQNEQELSPDGEIAETSVVFLTNRECPWRCLMCDLWKNTTMESVPVGAIPQQIEWALAKLPSAKQVKLYNSGSFFDHKAIPRDDYESIASLLKPYQRVIVESHPDLVGDDTLRFRDMIDGKLEVAMGLETAHPEVLSKLNKGITLETFQKKAAFLTENNIDLRVFILVKPPFLNDRESFEWGCRSLDFAFESGATAAILIPTRSGNGAMEMLAQQGNFSPPDIHLLESVLDYGIQLKKGRVFADLWDLDKFSNCNICFTRRKNRMENINRTQSAQPLIECDSCKYHSIL